MNCAVLDSNQVYVLIKKCAYWCSKSYAASFNDLKLSNHIIYIHMCIITYVLCQC